MVHKIPVVTYHSIDESGSVVSTSPDKFKSQMFILRKKNFKVISLQEVVTCIHSKSPFPAKAIAITFDDGFKNVYTVAYPILKSYGFTATVFLVPGYCGANNQWESQPEEIPSLDLLSWKEIGEMSDNGIDFGAHTMEHCDLSRVPVEKARDEIIISKRVIQKHLGKDVQCFAYPYGNTNDAVTEILHDEFSCACSTILGFVKNTSDVYALPRIDMYYFSKNTLFTLLGTTLFSLYIKIRSMFRFLKAG